MDFDFNVPYFWKKGLEVLFPPKYFKKYMNEQKYLQVLFGKSGIYKSKYSIKPLLHFTPTTKSATTL